jgi:hypothetical protein
MRVLLLALAPAVLCGQDEAPSSALELPVSGSAEFGYRSILSDSGNFNTYRSVVNLGEGPKLFNTDLRFQPSRYYDEASLQLRNWGGEPYSTLRADVRKNNAYNFMLDYRSIALFNYLPSFANPKLGSGSLLNQNAIDTRIRSTDARIDLVPSARVSPFFGYSRTSEMGGGVWVFARQGDEYPVPMFLEHITDHFRGGFQFNFDWLHGALEGGGTTLRQDQGSAEGVLNPGNVLTPYLGRQLRLENLTERYLVKGVSHYVRGSVAINPVAWASVIGEFTYSRPAIDVEYSQTSEGSFVVPRTLLTATTSASSFSGSAQMPRPSGGVRAEIRPMNRVRIIEWWTTDRFHNDTSGFLLDQYLTTGSLASFESFTPDRLVTNQSQQQVDVFVDIVAGLTVRGGHRFDWGDARTRSTTFDPSPLQEAALRRHVGLGGLSYRLGNRVRLNADYEAASTSRAFFRTSLRDYRKFRARASYAPQPAPEWRASVDFLWLDNENPDPTVRWDYTSRAATAILQWFPWDGRYYDITAEYTRATLHSRIDFIVPQTFDNFRNRFREASNSGTVLVNFRRGGWHPRQPGITLGGSFVVNNGNRPTRYYQPMARVSVPLANSVAANGEWRWYSMTQRIYSIENFGSHQLLLSLTLSR